MKTLLVALLLLLVLPITDTRAENIRTQAFNRNRATATASWPSSCVVNVYFVHDVFDADEQQTLWEAIEAWTQTARNMDLQITFINAGETRGLIDCANCLTITRETSDIDKPSQHVSFNTLRQDQTGHLISAWIGFARSPTNSGVLKTLMRQALRRGLAEGYATRGR